MNSEILFNEKIKLLYIDDEENNLHALKATFRREFDVDIAISTAEARPMIEQNSYEVIISDQRMPDQTGVEFFQEIKFTHPDPVRILLTGYADITAVVDAINMGEIYRYLQKPWNFFTLFRGCSNSGYLSAGDKFWWSLEDNMGQMLIHPLPTSR